MPKLTNQTWLKRQAEFRLAKLLNRILFPHFYILSSWLSATHLLHDIQLYDFCWQVQTRGRDCQWWLWYVWWRSISGETFNGTGWLSGSVFLGVHTIAGKEVAVKIEPAVSRNISSPLKQESKIYKTLMGGPGVPWIMWSGKQGDYNVMIIDLMGPSLEDLFKMYNRNFSLKTVLLLADQLVSLSFS